MKNYKVKQLTRQYNGHTRFKYVVQPATFDLLTTRQQLVEWREWCWATYLKSDAELVLFELKF